MRTTFDKYDELPDGANPVRKKAVLVHAVKMDHPFSVKTIEGTIQGKKGDFLVKGVRGELYPVDAEIFEETYEEA